ncbi:hypothetical protein ABEH87_11575 [Erwinia sp. Eh17-17]|jgi:hypothetical protein|uniref:hypothetical protein n=1 Tax=Erwinia sp. Eh17-17 TaxID=3080330 RepID=UPI00320974B7
MTTYSFSAEKCFFLLNASRENYERNGNWPADATEISDDLAQEYLTIPPTDKQLCSVDGMPAWTTPPGEQAS